MSSKTLDQRPIHTEYVTSYHRTKTENGFNIDSAYLKRYYSVIDAEIFFGNEFVEDIAYIDWTVNQNTLPIFGYNSYVYDEVAQGSRIIQGVFDINFTSPNYLYQILQAAKEDSITSMKSYYLKTPTLSATAVDDKLTQGGVGRGENGSAYHAPIWPETFDIDIIYGQYTKTVTRPSHIFLEGVVLQNCQQVLSASATQSPPSIMERYTFLAKNIKTYG